MFDELVYVLSYDLLSLAEVLEEFRSVRASQPALHIVVTGRDAPPALIEAADLVTEMTEIKHPFTAGIRAQQGIEFYRATCSVIPSLTDVWLNYPHNSSKPPSKSTRLAKQKWFG